MSYMLIQEGYDSREMSGPGYEESQSVGA